MAAPTRPAPMPQPRPLASALVVEAMLPVTASVARASAAIFDLIDIRNSIRFERGLCWSARPVGRSLFESGSNCPLLIPGKDNLIVVTGSWSNPRSIRKRFRIKPVDICEQFAERSRAVIDQAPAFLRGGLCGIAEGAA